MGPKNPKTHIFPSVPDFEGETMRGAQNHLQNMPKVNLVTKKLSFFPENVGFEEISRSCNWVKERSKKILPKIFFRVECVQNFVLPKGSAKPSNRGKIVSKNKSPHKKGPQKLPQFSGKRCIRRDLEEQFQAV